MLDELQVRNLALIEEASLVFGPGLNVLTGETGTGKTALLNALKLLIGERADASMVRDGASELRTEALFSMQNSQGLVEYLVARRVGSDGRSRCTLNDEMVTVRALSEQVGPLVDLCGQHEHQSLLRPEAHRETLDVFGGKEITVAHESYRQALQVYREAAKKLEDLEGASRTATRDCEQATFVLREIKAVSPIRGEYEELEAQLPRLRGGGELAQASDAAYQALSAEGSALELLASAQQELARSARIDPELDGLAAQLDELCIVADDLSVQLRTYRDSVEFDPEALDRTLERLGQLEALRKRFGPRMEDVFETFEKAQHTLDATENIDEHLRKAGIVLKSAREQLEAAAKQLEECRAQAASVFAHELTEAARTLAMSDAVFSFEIRPLAFDAWTSQASCKYELYYQPTSTSTPRPLTKIASGGELSRIMLAYKTVIHELASPITLVFDEIDAGVGGTTATVIAERLAELAQTHQVIVVTHLAQIAAKAQTHWIVEKRSVGGHAVTDITHVVGEARVDEIARMLAGQRDDLAREHARQLLGERV